MAQLGKLATFLALIAWITLCAGAGELQLVQVVFRHGDRNPLLADFPPNDPYKRISYWPEGYGQLTNVGKEQQNALGQWLRFRYNDFLSKSVSSIDEIFVQSSYENRAIMSADSLLAGMFPRTRLQGEIDMASSPDSHPHVPILPILQDYDSILQMSAPCPRLVQLNDDLLSGKEMSEIYTQNNELFSYLERHSGKNMRNLLDIRSLYDVLEIENRRNYSLPAWSRRVFPGGPFFDLTSLSFQLYSWDEEIARLKAGPLLKELIQNMEEKVARSPKFQMLGGIKLFLYSGHDCSTMSLLTSLRVWNGLPPPYASAVIIELRKLQGSLFVEMYYKNDTTQENPHLLVLPGCKASCPLNEFMMLTQPLVPQNWDKECYYEPVVTSKPVVVDSKSGIEEGAAVASFFKGSLVGVILILIFIVLYFIIFTISYCGRPEGLKPGGCTIICRGYCRRIKVRT